MSTLTNISLKQINTSENGTKVFGDNTSTGGFVATFKKGSDNLGGSLTLEGNLTAGLTSSDTHSFRGTVTFGAGTTVSINDSGNITVGGTSTFNGTATFNGIVDINSTITGDVNGDVKVDNTATLVLSVRTAPATPQAGQIFVDSVANRLKYHNGTSFKIAANTDEIAGGGDIVKVASVTTSLITLQNTTTEATVFEILFTPDFTTYPNGYWVFISPNDTYQLIEVTNDNNGDGTGVAGQFELRHYYSDTNYGSLYFHYSTSGLYITYITQYIMRVVPSISPGNFNWFFSCLGRFSSSAFSPFYAIYNSTLPGFVHGANSVNNTISSFNKLKLTAKWSVADPELYARVLPWQIVLYGLK